METRGLQADVVQNTRIDGLNIAATTDYAIEQLDRIEVLKGLSGALYGPASPARTFQYVFKRPTARDLTRDDPGLHNPAARRGMVRRRRAAGPLRRDWRTRPLGRGCRARR